MAECPACVATKGDDDCAEAPTYLAFNELHGDHDRCILCNAVSHNNVFYIQPGTIRAVVAAAWRLGGLKAAREVMRTGTRQYARVDDWLSMDHGEY
jgi:hypothetical protein